MSTTDNSPDITEVDCPTCGTKVAWIEANRYRPFCSKKCQLIDFGDWASERHSIPAEEPPDDMGLEDLYGSGDDQSR